MVWHDLECGSYREDLALWRSLAAEHGDPVLDVGAGTGRVAIELARAGHTVTALDSDAQLLSALTARADGLDLQTVVADARCFAVPERYPLCLVPMQTIQLLGGAAGRRDFLVRAREHLAPDGVIAIAIADELEVFEVQDGLVGPLPDILERDGVVYSSQPTAVRAEDDGFVLERRRETVDRRGERTEAVDLIRLDRVGARQLEREAMACGLRSAGRANIPPTDDYVGSEVVILRV